MNDIPDWAGKRACELLNAESPHFDWRWPEHSIQAAVSTVAKLVMQHEQQPADPDEEAVKRILQAWWSVGGTMPCLDGPHYSRELAAAVSQYKQEKANG